MALLKQAIMPVRGAVAREEIRGEILTAIAITYVTQKAWGQLSGLLTPHLWKSVYAAQTLDLKNQ
jgi:hypothetical protein